MPVTPTAVPDPQTRVIGPQVAADHLEFRFERVAIDAHTLDRAGCRALARTDLCAFERRSGRARRGQQALAIADQNLGVRADVDDQRHLVTS